ncbi:MAG: phosphopantetheine adenylyltransferase [Candidatus Hadarchaeota archaeon]|nr:phosphopantetheine adenylyltransferase [Candidatus Hadarchaeota archaeon]
MRFRKVAVGGTFDYLHDGHVAILKKSFEVGEHVLIGIVSDRMKLAKDSAGIQPLKVRKQGLFRLLRSRNWIERAEVRVISDPYGPTAEDEQLEAIVVSQETKPRAEEINKIRARRGLKPLEIIEIPLVLAEDGTPISSIRIRYGEMDTHGKLKKPRENGSDLV